VINELMGMLNGVTRGNDMLNTVILLSVVGAVFYRAGNVFTSGYEVLKRYFTTTLSLDSSSNVYSSVNLYLEELLKGKDLRTIKLDRWYNEKATLEDTRIFLMGVGLGSHYVWVRGKLLYVQVSEKESGVDMISTLSLTHLGRSNAYFAKFVHDLQKREDDSGILRVYRADVSGISRVSTVPKYTLGNIILPEKDRAELLKAINLFMKGQEKYSKRGVPWHFGLLLHGVSGTGKSLLIKVLANHYGRHLIYAGNVGAIESALTHPKASSSIIVVEEVDTLGIGNRNLSDDDYNPDRKNDTLSIEEEIQNQLDTSATYVLGRMLQALDGVAETPCRFVIMTTNNKSSLDASLLRHGRTDHQLFLGYLTTDMFWGMLRKFEYEGKDENFEIKEGIAPSELQNSLMLEKSYGELIQEFGK